MNADYSYLYTSGVCALEMHAQAPGMSIVKSFDEKSVDWTGGDDPQAILDWMKKHSIPSMFEYTKAYDNLIFTQRYPTLVLFTDLNDLDKLTVKDAFEEASKEEKFKHKILFAKADKN
jgi:hypothetical protein